MEYEEAYARLMNHASLLSGQTAPPDEESLHFIFFKADEERIPPSRMEALYRDVLACLEVINRALNGTVPSGVTEGKETHVERGLAYAMWMIIDDTRRFYRRWDTELVFEREILHRLDHVNSGISCAWGAVLAGDIDDVCEHMLSEGLSGN